MHFTRSMSIQTQNQIIQLSFFGWGLGLASGGCLKKKEFNLNKVYVGLMENKHNLLLLY